jgi:hypothetical protein
MGIHMFIIFLSQSGILMGLQEHMLQIVRDPLYFIILVIDYYAFSFIPSLALLGGFYHFHLGHLEYAFKPYGFIVIYFHLLE